MRIRVTAIKNIWLRRAAICASAPLLFVAIVPLGILQAVLRMLDTLWRSIPPAWNDTAPEVEHCEVGILGDRIVIHMPLSLLKYAAENSPFIHRTPFPDDPADVGAGSFRVTDERVFVQAVVHSLLTERSEGGGTLLHEMFDDAIEDVVENGGPGYEWPATGVLYHGPVSA